MKMPQEKNGENTDLKFDLVLCRNMNSENGGHHKIGTFEMRIWRRTEKISWTEHLSDEVLKLVERSLLTIIRTRQRNWMRLIMRGNSLQREVIKGRMESKRG